MERVLTVTRHAVGRMLGEGAELAFGFWPGRERPIVALHGLTASHVNFIGIAERLSGSRAVFAPDLRGRGDSDKPDGPYGMRQHARDVSTLMRTLRLGPSVVVGHSMGAFVAAAVAEQAPDLVSGLVMIDGGFVPALARVDSSQRLDSALKLRIEQLRSTYRSHDAYLEFWRAQPHFPPGEWNPWIEAFLTYELGGEVPCLQPKASTSAVLADLQDGLDVEEIIRRLHSVGVPVMFIRAEYGFVPGSAPLYPSSSLDQFRRQIPQVEDHFFAGTTHYTIVLGDTGATKLADLIADFAARCETPNHHSQPG
ncbi:MAG: alpha/beta hydrolase [Acidobacteriales bacterium]|nr:alpha/beta hydrolase [Terriglobales bacterium]